MKDLVDTLCELNKPEEIFALFGVLLTPKEIEEVNNRWKGCQLAISGVTQRKIRAQLGVSNATAARCARVVRSAPADFTKLIPRLEFAKAPSNLTTNKEQ